MLFHIWYLFVLIKVVNEGLKCSMKLQCAQYFYLIFIACII